MDLEMKFLTAFYAALTVITSIALVVVLIDVELGAMLVVVVALFIGIAVLGATLAGERGNGDGHPVR